MTSDVTDDGGKPDEDEQDDYVLLAQISHGHQEIRKNRSRLIFAFLANGVVRTTLVLAGAACAYFSVTAQPGSFIQSLLANVAAGIGVFVAAAPVLRAARRSPGHTALLGLLIATALLAAAYVSGPATQPVLLSGGCGVLLLLALDLNVAQWLDAASRSEKAAREKLYEAIRKVGAAEDVLDYKYALHDHLNLPRDYEFSLFPKGTKFFDDVGGNTSDDD